MQTSWKRLFCTIAAFAFAYTGAKPLAAQENCKLVFASMMKVFDTPTRSVATMTVNGSPQQTESVFVGGLVYAKFNGKWTPGSKTDDLKQMTEKNRQSNKSTCELLKEESIAGEMTAVYNVHEVSPKGTADTKIWISKSTGLPLRSDLEMEGGKMRISTHYEYSNVKAPM